MRAAAVLAVFVLGCSLFDSVPKLDHAVATLQCGPADQGFTSILLAHDPIASPLEPPFPHVSVMMLVSVDDLAGRTFDITSDLGPVVWYVTGPMQRESAISGYVRVTSVDSTRRVVGTVELRFPSRAVRTDFSAPWVEPFFLCG
jgi:hypothetical protein